MNNWIDWKAIMPIHSFRFVFITCLLMIRPTSALEIHYDPERDNALVECDQKSYSGLLSEANSCFQALLNHSDPLIQAESARALGNIRDANRYFRLAGKIDRENPYLKTRWARLYLSTHQKSDAVALFREALRIDPDYLPAKLGLAAAFSRQFEGKVRTQLSKIIDQHPDALEARLLMARLELEIKDTSKARLHLERALQIAQSTSQAMLEIFALSAAADLLDGKTDSDWTRKSLQHNKHYGGIYSIPAYFYIITYRYAEAVELYRKAIQAEPRLWSAHSALGINLLRINNISEARNHLQIAYQGDPFDTATVNTLRLLDTLEKMEVIEMNVDYLYPKAGQEDISETNTARIIIRLDAEEAGIILPYLKSWLTKAVQTLSLRYRFKPQEPIVVELYPNHDDFAVRTVSTPGVGLLGVTFGYLFAMDSPRARAEGEFHWTSTLWHELVHVFTLEASNHRLPRWFGEGLSVYEEWRTGPLPGPQIPIDVFKIIRDNGFLPVAELDRGFIRPSYDGQVNISYMQAGLICDFIASRWGHTALQAMLQSFSEGLDTREVFEQVLDMGTEQFDALFTSFLLSQYQQVVKQFDQWQASLENSRIAIESEMWDKAVEYSRNAIALNPHYTGPLNAYLPLAKALEAKGEKNQAMEQLLIWQSKGGHQPEILIGLAKELAKSDRIAEAVAVLEALNAVAPYKPQEHTRLGKYYLQLDQPQQALNEFEVATYLDPDDPAGVLFGKAQAHKQLGDIEQSRKQVLFALEQAPYFREAQQFLMQLVDEDPS